MTQYECDELWNQLTSDERSCVSMYKVCGVKAEAARHIDKTPKWLDNRQRTKPAFRRALDSVGQWPLEDIDRRQNAEISISASVFLRRVIESDDTKPHHRLAATRIVARMLKSLGI